MKSYTIIFVVILTVFISASSGASGDGSGSGSGSGGGSGKNHISIKTKADCDAYKGVCNSEAECDLKQNIHMESVTGGTCGGEATDFCCISKMFMCVEQANGTFIPDDECLAKGFHVTAMNLDGLNCCKDGDDKDDDDANGGSAVSRLSSGAVVLMVAVCAYRMF